jgi:hypothetical protein
MRKVWIDRRGEDDGVPGEGDASGGGKVGRGDDWRNHGMYRWIVSVVVSLA